MRRMRARRALAAVVVVLLACTADPAVEGDPAEQQSAATAPDSPAAADLRLRLEQHFGLFAAAVVATLVQPEDPAKAAQAMVTATLDDLSATIAEAYDQPTAEEFTAIAGRYPGALAEYAEAVGGPELLSSGAAPTAERLAVLRVPTQLATFMSTVTGGEMEEEGTAALLRAPTMSLLKVAGARVTDDYETAYAQQREAYAAMISVGSAFAAGISEQMPEQYPGLRNSGAVELRSALQQLLGEHSLLAAGVTRRALRGTRDFEAAAAALNGNTEDLTGALDSIYSGSDSEFDVQWRARISLLADHAVAVARDRAKAVREARAALAATDRRIAMQLVQLSDDTIESVPLTQALRALTGALLEQTTRSAAKTFAEADESAVAAHEAAADLAALIAQGIAAHRPSEFPAQ